MGLFKKKSDEQLIAEAKDKLMNEDNRLVVELAVGTHGTDELLAGALIGETGKLIAMSKYGKTKWQPTYLRLFTDGLRVDYNSFECPYDQLISFELTKTGWIDNEFILHSTNGDLLLKLNSINYQALVEVVDETKPKYMQELEENQKQLELEKQKEEYDKDMDRLLRAGELHERGLLSKEEFEEIKSNVLKNKPETITTNDNLSKPKYCPQCGSEIKEEYLFCVNCGHELK